MWLLNNDAITEPNTLAELIGLMVQEPRCGACSPVIKRLGNPEVVDFCGAIHNWQSLGMLNPPNIAAAPSFRTNMPTVCGWSARRCCFGRRRCARWGC